MLSAQRRYLGAVMPDPVIGIGAQKEVVGVNVFVAEELVEVTMKLIGSTLGDQVDARSSGATEFGRI
jgi:hypothetical protein